MRRQLGVVGVLLASLVLLGACGSASTLSSGIYGIAVANHGGLMASPPTPAPLPGGFGLSELEPYSRAAIVVATVTENGSGKVVANVTAGADGIFKVALAPGPYVVRYAPPYASADVRVTVQAGKYARVIVQTFRH